jgi:hypothetical protein
MPDVPQAAIDAAAEAMHCPNGDGKCGCQDAAEHEHFLRLDAADAKRGLQAAAPHLYAATARINELEILAGDILASYHQTSDGYRGRVGQVQIARWQAILYPERDPR